MTAARGTGNRIRRFLSAHSLGAGIAARFAAALMIGFAVRSRIGYHAVLSSPPVLIAAAAVVSPLPDFALGIYMAALVLAQAFAAGTEAGCVAAVLLVMLFLLFLHGSGNNAAVFALTASTGCFGFLPVLPLLCGIRRKLSAVPAILSGAVLCSFLGALPGPGSAAAASLPADFAGRIQYLCGRIFAGEFPVILLAAAAAFSAAFAVSSLHFVRASVVASVAGAAAYFCTLLIGTAVPDIHVNLAEVFLETAVSAACALVLSIVLLPENASRCERLIFEDDGYVYYVKAVPKVADEVRPGESGHLKTVMSASSGEELLTKPEIDGDELTKKLEDSLNNL